MNDPVTLCSFDHAASVKDTRWCHSAAATGDLDTQAGTGACPAEGATDRQRRLHKREDQIISDKMVKIGING
ncbi:hypothetical protein LDENG_00086430 [Lucifuga dentata]|nr:hypothetical protein LDENG_00086430 [Lucifuga dentata]